MREELRCCHAGGGHAYHDDPFASQFLFYGIFLHRFFIVTYRSFKVLMASKDKMIVTIQKRTMIFGSTHPFNSK